MSRGRGFGSQCGISTGWTLHFFTFTCCKICIVCLKRPKINKKEAGVGPFKKTKRRQFFRHMLTTGNSTTEVVLDVGQWLWHSRQSSSFRCQSSKVEIQSSTIIYSTSLKRQKQRQNRAKINLIYFSLFLTVKSTQIIVLYNCWWLDLT